MKNQSFQAAEACVLALNIGSSSIKSACFNLAGQVVPGSHAHRPQLLMGAERGRAEIEPDLLLLRVLTPIRCAGDWLIARTGVLPPSWGA